MAESVIVSELLCYLQNYFGNVPRTILCSKVSSFYDKGEIVEAKNCLFTWTNNANLGFDDVPQNKPRKTRDNKRKHDTDDIVALFEYLDYKKVMLPDFVAKKLSRLPAAKPSDVDLYMLTDTVNDVKAQIAAMQKMLKSLSDNQACLADTVGSIACTVSSVPIIDDTSACNNVEKMQPARRLSVRINPELLNVINLENDAQSGKENVDPNGLSKLFADMFGNTDDGGD